MSDLWQPLLLSLCIAIAATLLTALTAIPLAYVLARRNFRGKSVAEAAIMLPLVLPPTVVGYLLLVLFGRQGPIGRWLDETLDYSIVFTVEGAVVAAAIVAFPLLYISAKAAFASIEREYEDVARVMGGRSRQVFWHVSLPMARRGIVSGLMLSFARALGEFGATVMVLGWMSDRLTLPIAVYAAYEQGEIERGAGAVMVLSAISIALIAAYNRSMAMRQD
jgi:molybdate transport system permease protein